MKYWEHGFILESYDDCWWILLFLCSFDTPNLIIRILTDLFIYNKIRFH